MLKRKESGHRRKLLKWWQLERMGIEFYKYIDTSFDGFRGTWYYVDGTLTPEHKLIIDNLYENTYIARIGLRYAPEMVHDAIFISE